MTNDRPYRYKPLRTQLRVGDIVQRKDSFGMPSHHANRRGEVVGLPESARPGVWYVPVRWEGSRHTARVHLSRITRLLPPEQMP